jgi:hypothetical protein
VAARLDPAVERRIGADGIERLALDKDLALLSGLLR